MSYLPATGAATTGSGKRGSSGTGSSGPQCDAKKANYLDKLEAIRLAISPNYDQQSIDRAAQLLEKNLLLAKVTATHKSALSSFAHGVALSNAHLLGVRYVCMPVYCVRVLCGSVFLSLVSFWSGVWVGTCRRPGTSKATETRACRGLRQTTSKNWSLAHSSSLTLITYTAHYINCTHCTQRT